MPRDLIILSAEITSEGLQKYFGRLPSAMVPFANRPALDYIYHENINHYGNIYIVVKKESHFIEEYLYNSQSKIELIELPTTKDLAFSLEYALEQIGGSNEISILFGDTYIPYMNLLFKDNALLYAHSSDSERWTVVNVSEPGKIEFIDKEKLPEKPPYKIVIGAFHITEPLKLLEKLKEKGQPAENKFYSALKKYYNTTGFDFIFSEHWVDYGHIDKYFEQKKRVAARSFNHIKVDFERNIVEKRSKHVAKFSNEISWYLQLPEELEEYIPKIHNYSLDPSSPFVQMTYYNFLTLHEIFVHGNHSISTWEHIFKKLKKVLSEFSQYQASEDTTLSIESLREMYVAKSKKRLAQFLEQKLLDPDEPVVINGVEYLSLNDQLDRLEEIVKQQGLLEERPFCIIHGDFFLANILYDVSHDLIKLVDPRGSFGEAGIYGDPLYEWAKLSHSVDGLYDLIIADKFNVVQIGNSINYKLYTYSLYEEIKAVFYNNTVPKADLHKVKLIQALLFFSMLPLHEENPKRQLIMLCRAIELFQPFLDNLKHQ